MQLKKHSLKVIILASWRILRERNKEERFPTGQEADMYVAYFLFSQNAPLSLVT